MTRPGPTFPDVTLGAEDLVLRAVRETDAAPVADYCVDPLTQAWLPLPDPYTLDDARWFCTVFAPAQQATGRGLVRSVELSGRLAGMIDLNGAARAGLPAGRAARRYRQPGVAAGG